MKIGTKLIIHTTFVSIFAVVASNVLVSLWAYYEGKQDLEDLAKNRVVSVRDIKSEQITKYFENLYSEMVTFSSTSNFTVIESMKHFKEAFNNYSLENTSIDSNHFKNSVINHYLKSFSQKFAKFNSGIDFDATNLLNLLSKTSFNLQYHYIIENPYEVNEKSKLMKVEDGTTYSKVHEKYHKHFKKFKESFNIYDILLVDADTGNIIYSTAKQLDFTTSLRTGPYANSKIGEVFQKAILAKEHDFIAISDFSPYIPSYNNHQLFMASPIFDGTTSEKLGVIIFQISINSINSIMTSNYKWKEMGLGNTGETYLVGSDNKLRSESRFFIKDSEQYLEQLKALNIDPVVLTLINSKKTTVGLQPINTFAVSSALQGKTGVAIYGDYRGIEVLGAYKPLNIRGLNWAIVSKLDVAESFKLINKLTYEISIESIMVMLIVSLLSIAIGLKIASNINEPIKRIISQINYLAAKRDLTKRLLISKNENELDEMAKALNSLITSFQALCKETIKSTKQIKTAAGKLNSLAKDQDVDNDLLKDTGDDLQELSDRLDNLSSQFKFLEDESDKVSDW